MPPTILIVEDNDLVRESLFVWLSIAFPLCRFEQAASGEQAVSVALRNSFDLVLMDLGLPNMNGIEATRNIKASAPQTHVVLLSIQEDPQYVKDALQAVAAAFVSKRKMHTELIPLVSGLLAAPAAADSSVQR